MTDLPETSELSAFVQIADAGSLSRAASELGLPRPTVSARLARLEERLGVRLVHRSTRRLVLTPAGEELHQRARGVLAALEEARAAIHPAEGPIAGLLRVSAPPAGAIFAELLVDFQVRHPEVRLEVQLSAEHVDLIGSGYDVAIRAGTLVDPGLVCRTLVRTRLMALAAPACLHARGAPQTADDLTRHACIVGFAQGLRPATHWPLLDGGQVRVQAVLAANDIEVQRQAAVRGLGVALLPDRAVAADLAAGRLVPVLPTEVGGTSTLAVVYPERRYLAPAVRAFVDHVVAWSPRLFAEATTAR